MSDADEERLTIDVRVILLHLASVVPVVHMSHNPQSLPDEVLVLVLKHVPISSRLEHVELVCKRFLVCSRCVCTLAKKTNHTRDHTHTRMSAGERTYGHVCH